MKYPSLMVYDDDYYGGMVYVIGSREVPNRFKIGHTAYKSSVERMKALQIGSPVKLEIILEYPAPRDREKHLHRRLADYRVHGEWFEIPLKELADDYLPSAFEVDVDGWPTP